MSHILEKIVAILQLADSKKVTDRKKCISELLELYENETAIMEISKNSKKTDGTTCVTWWNILTVVHKLILWEADRYATKDVHKTNNTRHNTCAVLLNTMHYSHKSRTITSKCNELIERVLEIFYNRKCLYYRNTYLTILTTYILPVRLYRINILSEQWQKLLSVCINLYKEALEFVDKCTVIEAMQTIVQHGYVYSNLLMEMKRLLPLLANILSNPKILERMEESIYKVANTICYSLATENRITLCQFGEDILPKIIIDSSSYDEKYKFMLLFVQIHHPNGAHREDDGAFACNWNTWNEILWSMYRIILEDSKKGISLFKNFCHFASEVINQVLQNSDIAMEKHHRRPDLYSQEVGGKRRCIVIDGPVDMINIEDLEGAWPTIRILTMLFAKYPKRVKPDDFIPLLAILNTYLIRSCKDVRIIGSLYEMCTVLMETEQLFLVDFEKIIDSTNTHWYDIWDVLLRSLNANQCEVSAHTLARCFVKYGKTRNTNSLFTSYMSQTIRWTPSSLETLITCCEYTPLPAILSTFETNLCTLALNTRPIKLRFMEWLLNTPWFKFPSTRSIESLCNILIGIPAKLFRKKKNTTTFEYPYRSRDSVYDDSVEPTSNYKIIETCNLAVTFQINLFTKSTTTETRDSQEHLEELFVRANVNLIYLRNVIAFLREYLYEIVDDSKEKKNESYDICATLTKIALVCKVATTVKRMNIFLEDSEIRPVMCAVESCLKHAYSLLQIVKSRSQCNQKYLIDSTNAFLTLYETLCHTYDTDVAKTIVSLSTVDILKTFLEQLNIEDEDDGNGDGDRACHENCSCNDNFFDTVCRILYRGYISEYSNVDHQANCKRNDTLNTIKGQTMRTLMSFCRLNTGKEKSKIQFDLMNGLTTIGSYDFARATDFKIAMIVLESFVRYDNETLYEKYENTPILFLLDLLKWCKNDTRYVRRISRILPYLIKYAASHDYDLVAIMDRVYDLCEIFRNKGPLVHVELLKYLSEVIGIGPLLIKHRQYARCRDKLWQPVIENLLNYIRSPFFVIRLEALDCVRKLYSSKIVEYERKVSFFDKLNEIAVDLLSVKMYCTDDKADEMETRTASVLLVFAMIINFSIDDTFKTGALIAVLRLIDHEYIKLDAARKVLHSTATQTEHSPLDEDNMLARVLSNWLSTDHRHTVQTFPWALTRCASQNQFYDTYIDTLVFAEIKQFNVANARKLCARSNKRPFKDVFENIFARVLSWLLSSIHRKETVRDDSLESKRTFDMLRELTSNRGNFETMDTFSDLFEANFDKVVARIVLMLHDEEHFHKIFQLRCQFPRTDPPVLDKADVDGCLRYIEKHFISSGSLQNYLAAGKGIGKLQRILLNLVSNIYDMNFIEHKLKAFHQYAYFCTIVTEGLKFDYFDAASAYLVREISYTLIHFIKGENNDALLSETACTYFHVFLKRILPERCTEVKDHLNYVVTSLVPVARIGKTSAALRVLEYLIVDQNESLGDAIAELNTFPSLPIFKRIRKAHDSLKYKGRKDVYDLEKEIRHFLEATNQNITCSLESLSFLKLQLSTRRNELQEMYDRLDSDDDDPIGNYRNLLHRLIRKLLEIVGSTDRTISIEATKCLGELGPVDLGATILLPNEKSNRNESVEAASDVLTHDVITLLTEFLVDANVKLRVSSANALYAVMSSVWGQRIVDNKKPVQYSTTRTTTRTTTTTTTTTSSIDRQRPPLRVDYISPFIHEGEEKALVEKKIILHKVSCDTYINANNPIWTKKSCIPYGEWIVQMTCNVVKCLSDYFLEDLTPICKLSTQICELILPQIVLLIMSIKRELAIAMRDCIDRFFYYHFNVTNQSSSIHDSSQQSQRTSTVHRDRDTIRFMLNLVNFLRTRANENVPLELNFTYVAKAARYCSAYFTAFLYAEISCESLLTEPCDFSNIPKIDYVCEREPVLGRTLQDILRDACSKIGDPDAIRGCGSSHLRDRSSRIRHYMEMQEWDKVLFAKDIQLSSGNETAIEEMIDALQHLGLHYLLGYCISATTNSVTRTIGKPINDIGLECAWRLSNWDIPMVRQTATHPSADEYDTKLLISESDDYHLFHFNALRCFHERDEAGVKDAIDRARTCIAKDLLNINLERNKEIYVNLMRLQMLSEIEELCLTESDDYSKVLQKWRRFNVTNLNEFQYTEPILTQRSVMYRINDTLRDNPIVKGELANVYIEIADVAQNQGHLQIAARALGTLAEETELLSKFRDRLDYQESLLAWKRNDREIGRYLLRNLIQKKSIDPKLQARALCTYGNWMAETKSENPQTVIEKYFEKSIEISTSERSGTSADTTKISHDAQVALAKFTDDQYEHVKAYMKSPQFKSLKKYIEYSCSSVKYDTPLQDTDLRRAVILSQKQHINDIAELRNIESEKDRYLLIALRYFILTLRHSEDYNSLVFRLIALWHENANNKEVSELLSESLDDIPSFKFIPLIPQLAAHTSNVSDDFSTNVNKILTRCALDHPHHTLPVLLALKNSYGDYEFLKAERNAGLEEEPRILGAKRILKELHASKVGPIICEMEKLSRALVMLANYDSTNKCKRGTAYKIPAGQEILKIKDFYNISVSTLTVNVKRSGNYDSIVGIAKYANTFESVGGANAPKKIVCIGVDGTKLVQLLKGKDDLRQDGVMQQVFNVMNGLFRTSKETRRRKLKIRTYKVVPLTQRSGILEWCEDTLPIATILTGSDGNSGLHKKYNPRDYTAATCRKKMDEVSKKSNEIRLQRFLECCRHMRPAFHHFFFEKYPSPVTWYEKRLAYTRSVATTSIAGYILGLGDRHLSNILMDQSTAEVIHIDFGIAFEQGKLLPIPETVPFRLTRDMEDAMGVSGVEGIMRRACEEVLTVLRDQSKIIITLLQVLLYDPLFTWAITPAKAYKFPTVNAAVVPSEDIEVLRKKNKTAERALLRIEQKLRGIEEGLVLSVPGQVEQLLQQARDPSNLSRLFSGWQPYL